MIITARSSVRFPVRFPVRGPALLNITKRQFALETSCAMYAYGAKKTFAIVLSANILAGSYVRLHSGWFYGYLGFPAVFTLSFLKALSIASVWPVFWPWATARWLLWPARPCMIGHEDRDPVLSFVWKYNRHGPVPHCIPGHDIIVANLNPCSDYRSWPEYLGLRTPLIEQTCDCKGNIFCASCYKRRTKSKNRENA